MPDPTSLKKKTGWTVQSAAEADVPMLSVYKVQSNTQWMPQNSLEQDYLRRYLNATLEEAFTPENLHNYATFGPKAIEAGFEREHAHRLYAERDGGVIVGMRFLHNVEFGGGPGSNARAHSHGLLYIAHRSNFYVEGNKLQTYLPHVWDQLSADDPDTENRRIFTNGPNRSWNVRVQFIRPNEETMAWFYSTKNVRDFTRQMVEQRFQMRAQLEVDFDSQPK